MKGRSPFWTGTSFYRYHNQRSPELGEKGAAFRQGRNVGRGCETSTGDKRE